MRRLKFRSCLLAALVLVISLGIFYFGFGSNICHPSEGHAAEELQKETGTPQIQPPAARLDQGTVSNRERIRLQQEVRARPYLCERQGDERCMASLAGASSVAEALWLIENGYPTPDQLRDVDAQLIPIAELERNAASGDLIALGLLGRACNNSGQPARASTVLSKAIANGSVYGVYELSRTYASKDYPETDIHASAAHMRAAYLLGDVKAARYLYESYPSFGTTEFAMADEWGSRLYAGLIELRARNGVTQVSGRPMQKE